MLHSKYGYKVCNFIARNEWYYSTELCWSWSLPTFEEKIIRHDKIL